MNYLIIIGIIGFLIFFHELGHFIFAKIVGINIASFSIGYGPVLFRWKRKETEYRISLIPLGGYVMPEVKDEKEFFNIPVYKRMIFSIGGPFANIFLPLIALAGLGIFNSGISFTSVLITPVVQVFSSMLVIINGLSRIFISPERLSGVIGIVAVGGKIVDSGILNAINLLIMLSLNLAVFNLFPIPALDGGKILLYILEKIHPKLKKIQIPVTIGGWLILLVLIVYATYNDIAKLVA
ncbi:MAG: site-2 protease family protein [Spirochaetes bacterium]|nr:site-2 protease family protein [Spirochaetota bacterium]